MGDGKWWVLTRRINETAHQHQVTGLWLRRVEENRGAVWRHAYSINGPAVFGTRP
jgi:hypothetical protein